MKLSPDSTFPLIVLMTCMELFHFITARPTNITHGKKDLSMMYQDMRKLMKLVAREKNANDLTGFEHSLTSLPSLNYSIEDLNSLEISSTLEHMYSGLKSFKFHLDWIQKNNNEMGGDSRIKAITHLVQTIIHKVLRELGTTVPEIVHPSLPPPKTFWNLRLAKAEIYQKLFSFCDWYTRALGLLKHKHQ